MNIEFMKFALDIAAKSGEDVPVGAVIVKNGDVISKAVNEREKSQVLVHHAEILAIERANRVLNNWRLTDCEMYVTLEPCFMCAGAIVQSRLKAVYFGAYDLLNGALGSKINISELTTIPLIVKGGIMEYECKKLLQDYFERARKNCLNKHKKH